MIKDTLDIECLIQSLFTAIEASNEETKQRENYDGLSWGYHGSYLINEKDNAMKDFADRLESYVDKRIEQKLSRYELVERND